jgi:hypothetical protein
MYCRNNKAVGFVLVSPNGDILAETFRPEFTERTKAVRWNDVLGPKVGGGDTATRRKKWKIL